MDYSKLNDILTKGSKKTLFYVAVVPVNPMGQVLVAERREDGIWTTPAGGQEGDETPEETAVRELWEEAGIACIPSMLEQLGVKPAPNGKPVHCFLLRTNQTQFSVKMDPDREVAGWNWYSRENLPDGLSRQKNANRLQTISEAMMKFYGLCKSTKEERRRVLAQWTFDPECQMETIEDMTEERMEALCAKLNKGGEGSGVKGHKTPKKDQIAQLNDLGFAAQDLGQDLDPKHYASLPKPMQSQIEEIKKIADEYHEVAEDSPKYPEIEKKLGDATHKFQLMAKELVMKKSDEIEKGGPGSGVVGHVTAKKELPHVPHPANQVPQVNKLSAHLQLLQSGGAIPNVHTKSGKPVLNDLHAARAQGYTVEDYTDAMNVHYNMAQKVNQIIEKMKMAGKPAPKEAVAIAQFHEKKMQETMRARDRLESRTKKTKAAQHNHVVKKSVTQMGSGLGDRDLDIGSYAQANSQASDKWMETLHVGMDNFNFGDEPRSFQLPKGRIHLCKVDDGLYSGFFTKEEIVGDGMLEDNAKVRIERQTIPELVTFMMAQEWIVEHLKAQTQPDPAEMEPVAPEAALIEKLSQPVVHHNMVSQEQFSSNEQRIRMLELVAKLIG